jgi:hypothetical protein
MANLYVQYTRLSELQLDGHTGHKKHFEIIDGQYEIDEFKIREHLVKWLNNTELHYGNKEWWSRFLGHGHRILANCQTNHNVLNIEDSKYQIHVVATRSRGGYKVGKDIDSMFSNPIGHKDIKEIIYSWGFYVKVFINTEDDERGYVPIGMTNGGRVKLEDTTWGVPVGSNTPCWITNDKSVKKSTTALLITLGFDSNKNEWKYSHFNTMYPVDDEEFKFGTLGYRIVLPHQVAGDLFCIMKKYKQINGEMLKSELDKTTKFNTYLRLKNTYFPDKEGKVFAIYSEK